MRLENPPFPRGETFYNGLSIDSTNLGGLQFEGAEWEFEDVQINAGVGAKPNRTNMKVRCRCVRNVAAIALQPKRLVTFQLTAGMYGSRVDGYATTTAQRGFPVDEYLPAAGVPVNDLFWIVVAGPALVLTPLDAGSDNVINVGDAVVALTAATSGATTAGRVYTQDLTGATSLLANQVQDRVGYALSAVTTGNTGANLLIEVTAGAGW